jgi:2-polyprenyl-6-methoxyphenol hydroxylase-like FAD-dependent oxidoreductase
MAAAGTSPGRTEAVEEIAIVGGGPAALASAIALARRGIRTTVYERDAHPAVEPRFNPDRAYAVDISGHGLRALRHIDACGYFDDRMIRLLGQRKADGGVEEWPGPAWIGSRGDIQRSLMALVEAKYHRLVTIESVCRVTGVDVDSGLLNLVGRTGHAAKRRCDFVIGADGAGSVVRQALQRQVPGFAVRTESFPNWCTMIELDRVGDQLDQNYLHELEVRPWCMAGAIRGESATDTSRWFCAIGTSAMQVFLSTEEAEDFLLRCAPRILDLASPERIEAYARRPCYHIGQALSCSQFHGGKAVLLGDAAAGFPPIGQGVNAALESAMVLDQLIGELGHSPEALLEAGRRYTGVWKPEADAVSWLSVRHLFENRFHALRATISTGLGRDIHALTRSADLSYSEVRRSAERLWPLWR